MATERGPLVASADCMLTALSDVNVPYEEILDALMELVYLQGDFWIMFFLNWKGNQVLLRQLKNS
jgi:hypothetical protein